MRSKKTNNKLTISYREFFFYLYFAVMFGMRMWGVYEGTMLYGPLLVLGFLLWGVSVLMTRHTVLEYLIMGAFLALAAVVYLNSGEKGLLLYFTLMLGMKNIDIKKLFKVGIVAGGIGMALLVFLTSFGILEEVAYLQSRPHIGTIFRHALGMPHPNTLSSSFFIISVMVMYVIGHEDRIKVWKTSGILAVIAAYLYSYSGSRTGIAINFGYLALNLFYAYRKKTGIIEKTILTLLLPVIWGVSILLPALATDALIDKLLAIDHTLMSRLEIGKDYLQKCPVTLFGTVVFDGTQRYGIDLSQLNLFLNLGIIAFVVVSVLNIWLVADEVKENRISELVITFTFLVMGVTDPFLYNISFKNLCFVFMGAMIYRYLAEVHDRIPQWMRAEIQPIGIEDAKIAVDFPGWIISLKESARKLSCKKRGIAFICSVSLALLSAALIYIMSPVPQFALADRNEREHILIKELVGKTYTEGEIEEIKSHGNVVLNYKDENELMYVYYSDENEPIEGGYYSKNAALMEKVRKSISVLFWGTIGAYGIIIIAESGINLKKERI